MDRGGSESPLTGALGRALVAFPGAFAYLGAAKNTLPDFLPS